MHADPARKPAPTNTSDAPRIALVAGEDSGDQLGANLIHALRALHPDARFVGIGGPRMRAVGFESWHDIAELSVMGLAEVLRHLPRLLGLRRSLARRLRDLRPDVVIGIDAPDFNLGLERTLKAAGIPTVHYVSPSVWAWRESRAARIGASADRVLCLFPIEPPIYARHGVDARFVGHPMADRFALVPDRAAARRALGLDAGRRVLAVLPGSRASEIARLADIFLDAAARVAAGMPELDIVIPAANPRCFAVLRERIAARPAGRAQPILLDGDASTAVLAADVALVASGTATLETLLAKTPMVVAYKIAPLTYAIVRGLGMMKTDYYALPNFLAGEHLVPELMQDACTADALAAALAGLFADDEKRAAMRERFVAIHQQLLGTDTGASAAERAARAVHELIARPADARL